MRLPDYFKDYVFDQFVSVDEDGVATFFVMSSKANVPVIPFKKFKEWVLNGLQPGGISEFLEILMLPMGNNEDLDLRFICRVLYYRMDIEDFADEMREHFKKRIKCLNNDPIYDLGISSTIDRSARIMVEVLVEWILFGEVPVSPVQEEPKNSV